MNKEQQDKIYKAALAIAPFHRMSQKRDYFIKGADYALSHQWISVDESLPPCPDDVISEVSVKVIAKTNNGAIYYAFYHHYLNDWFSAETSTRIDNVTKWMYVP